MDKISAFLVSSASLAAVLIILNALLLLYFYKTNKKLNTLLEKGKIKDFKSILLSQSEKNDELVKD